MTRIAFLGTPDSAVPVLRALDELFDVVGVVTQPDAPRGRSKALVPSEVSQVALDMGLEVYTPADKAGIVSALRAMGPVDVGVVVAYGRLLDSEALSYPAMGMLNVHFSLLPRWRGAAPVARALMEGDAMTGVTIIRLDEGLDTGPVLTAQAIDIGDDETAETLTQQLAAVGARLMASSIAPYLAGQLLPIDQTEDGLTYAAKLTSADRPLNRHLSPEVFVNRVRGLSPRPGATLKVDGDQLKILRASRTVIAAEPGSWVAVEGRFVVGLDEGSVELLEVHPPGKNPMSGRAWINGARSSHGMAG